MNNETGKAYLLETVLSSFHEDIIQEVKLNLEDLHRFFDPKGETYRVLLDVIGNHDSNRITKLIIKDALTTCANRSEEESNNLISRILEARKMNPDEVSKIRKRIKDICYQSFIEYARIQAGDDLEKYQGLIATYRYKDLGLSEFIIKDIESLDATILTEKYLNHPIKSSYEWINRAFQGKSGYLKGSLGIVCGRPKSGKSMFMMTEAVKMAMAGEKVFYLALGDLNELDFLSRMAAISTNTSLEVVISDIKTYKEKFIKRIKDAGGKLSLTILPSGTLDPKEFYNIAVNRLKEYSAIFIDYDLNFAETSDNMYVRGGELYDLLTAVKMETNALILVATQPNKAFWNEPFLDDTCFIESSKKSMIVDFAITIGKVPDTTSGTHCGYINIPINRRGSSATRPYIMCNSGELFSVPESVYASYSNDLTSRTFSYKELVMLSSAVA